MARNPGWHATLCDHPRSTPTPAPPSQACLPRFPLVAREQAEAELQSVATAALQQAAAAPGASAAVTAAAAAAAAAATAAGEGKAGEGKAATARRGGRGAAEAEAAAALPAVGASGNPGLDEAMVSRPVSLSWECDVACFVC